MWEIISSHMSVAWGTLVAMMTATRHQSPAARVVAERERARKLENRERRLRVEFLGLPHCLVCGGADTDPANLQDKTLRCVCAERRSALEARCLRIVGEHRDPADNLSDRIAP